MNWIKASEQMPELEPGEGFTRRVFVWIVDTDFDDGYGFADSGIYSRTWGGWIVEEGTLEEQGFRVTHWTEIEPPDGYRVREG